VCSSYESAGFAYCERESGNPEVQFRSLSSRAASHKFAARHLPYLAAQLSSSLALSILLLTSRNGLIEKDGDGGVMQRPRRAEKCISGCLHLFEADVVYRGDWVS
jgi:hypothetical protein